MSETAEQWVTRVAHDLKVPVTSSDDDLFDLGATSLTVMRLIGKAEVDLGVLLSPEDVIEAGTVREIAASICRAEKAADGASGPTQMAWRGHS